MKIGGCLARNIDFDVANVQLLVKTCRQTSIFELQLVKIEGGLARNARFDASTCLVWSLCLRPVCGRSCKTFRYPMCQNVKIRGSLERNHALRLQHVESGVSWLRRV